MITVEMKKEYFEMRDSIIESQYKHLNDRQKEAVFKTEGPVLILAGAGSGKTTTIINRIAYILKHAGMYKSENIPIDLTLEDLELMRLYLDSKVTGKSSNKMARILSLIQGGKARTDEVLALTFTNKAAQEMKDRIIRMNVDRGDKLWMSTFHSMCAKLLRFHGNLIGYERNFVIYDTMDQKSIYKDCLKELNIDDKAFPIQAVASQVSKAKEKGTSVAEFEKENQNDFKGEKVAAIYKLYQSKLLANNAMDFDDLLVNVVRLFTEHEDLLAYYQSKFKYIVVDEYQDTNPIQYKIVSLLARRYKNICVCGDDDQSIYAFRGADIRNILEFEKDFGDAAIIRLEQNYRSSCVIIEAANKVIENNPKRKAKKMWTENPNGDLIELKQLYSEREEADYVADTINQLTRKYNYDYGSFAVLYRTNAQSRVFEESFMNRGIQYQIIGGLKFYSRMEIKDILSYLTLLTNPKDDVSFKRVINVPKRGLGNASIEKIQEFADFKGKSLYEVVMDIDELVGLSKSMKAKLMDFSNIMKALEEAKESTPLSELIDQIMIQSGYMDMLKEGKVENAQMRIENLQELVSSAVEFETNSEDSSLAAYLESVSLVADIDNFDQEQGQVKLMTLHNAKGLEFPVVFIPGLEEGIFPHVRSLENDDELHEERRLCYVGMTRARERLFLTFSNYRKLYGKTNYNPKSRFLEEIPKDLLNEDIQKQNKSKKAKDNISFFANSMEKQFDRMNTDFSHKIKSDSDDIKVGTKVNHKVWGIGTVINIDGKGDEAIASVAFPGMGIKKLAVNMAPIEIVK